MRSLRLAHGFSYAKTLLLVFLCCWTLIAAAYLHAYIHIVEGSYSEDLPLWWTRCALDADHRLADCKFASWLRENVLLLKVTLVKDNMERQVFIWHHIASVLIFFIVVGAFVVSIYLAYLEFMREQNSPTDPDHPRLTAKFLGMEFSSSMIGLSILVLSFAFFMAYLIWVYPIQTGSTVGETINATTPQTSQESAPTSPST